MKPAAATVRADSPPQVRGALALELYGAAPVGRAALAQAEVGELAALMAADLAQFSGAAAQLELVLVGAHFDPVEMLRPHWPLHHELDQLAARAPKEVPLRGAPKEVPGASGHPAAGRVIAFGAHAGRLPGNLTPAPDFSGGPLRLVPFVLTGDAGTVAQVSAACEHDLIERGMAGAATALAAQAAFGLQVEHARYLTMLDLMAMMAMQYEHAGLAPLWPLLETALLQPDAEEWLDEGPEPLLHYVDGEVRIALFSPQAWRARYAADAPAASAEQRAWLDRQHQHFQSRQRQFAAVLGAHAVPVTFVHCDREPDCRDVLR